jgi:hypothetical protein
VSASPAVKPTPSTTTKAPCIVNEHTKTIKTNDSVSCCVGSHLSQHGSTHSTFWPRVRVPSQQTRSPAVAIPTTPIAGMPSSPSAQGGTPLPTRTLPPTPGQTPSPVTGQTPQPTKSVDFGPRFPHAQYVGLVMLSKVLTILYPTQVMAT